MDALVQHSALIRECGGEAITIETIGAAVTAGAEEVAAIIPRLAESCHSKYRDAPRLYDAFVKPWCPPLSSLTDGELACAWRVADYLHLPSDGLALETAQRVLTRDYVVEPDHAPAVEALVHAVEEMRPDHVARGRRTPVTTEDMNTAASWGQTESIKHARATNDYPWNTWTCASAAYNGHLETLKYAHENGCPWGTWTCAYAAQNGHLETLKWARENGCPWDWRTCAFAAYNGHLETLKWARGCACPWDEHTCAAAARNGHLEILKYAREGASSEAARAGGACPWDETTCANATDHGQPEALKWALANGCPCDEHTRVRAVKLGYLDA